MFDNGCNELSVLDDRFELLRHGPLDEHALLLLVRVGKRDVDRGRLGGDDLGLAVEALLGEVDLSRVGRVDEDGWDATKDLDGEGGGGGDREGGDDGLDENGGFRAGD